VPVHQSAELGIHCKTTFPDRITRPMVHGSAWQDASAIARDWSDVSSWCKVVQFQCKGV